MSEAKTYHLSAYSADLRWIGEVTAPSHQRFSDFINNTAMIALVLNHATPGSWQNNHFIDLPQTELIALPKRNLLFVVGKSELTLPPHSTLERIPKQPFPVIMYIPPFSLTGKISLPRHSDWLAVATAASENFLPVIEASIWHIQARVKIESDIPLILVNSKWLFGIEPKR